MLVFEQLASFHLAWFYIVAWLTDPVLKSLSIGGKICGESTLTSPCHCSASYIMSHVSCRARYMLPVYPYRSMWRTCWTASLNYRLAHSSCVVIVSHGIKTCVVVHLQCWISKYTNSGGVRHWGCRHKQLPSKENLICKLLAIKVVCWRENDININKSKMLICKLLLSCAVQLCVLLSRTLVLNC